MDTHYHTPDLFRYSLNSFIRAIKEIPQILKMELQNHSRYRSDFKPTIDSFRSNKLMSLLHKKRDFIVHKGMLDILSKGSVGTTEGRGIKISIPFAVAPHESTQETYERFKLYCTDDAFFRKLAGPDCDSWPIIRREWIIQEIPEHELLKLSLDTWKLTGEAMSKIVVDLGGKPLDLSCLCTQSLEKIKTMEFNQQEFFKSVDGISL